jgi:hypothetical protein
MNLFECHIGNDCFAAHGVMFINDAYRIIF